MLFLFHNSSDNEIHFKSINIYFSMSLHSVSDLHFYPSILSLCFPFTRKTASPSLAIRDIVDDAQLNSRTFICCKSLPVILTEIDYEIF